MSTDCTFSLCRITCDRWCHISKVKVQYNCIPKDRKYLEVITYNYSRIKDSASNPKQEYDRNMHI